MADNEKVLVNVNRLYARLVKTGNDCKAAYNALKKVPNERAMFVELTVKEAKECFAETLLDMPYNSFRKKETRYPQLSPAPRSSYTDHLQLQSHFRW